MGKLYVIYTEDWSLWQSEPNYYSLREAKKEDFEPNGRYESLGRKAGLGRSLSLDEALAQ